MQSLWPRVESLLSQVTKPARYIGGELGAQSPEHADGSVAWLLVYPDTYEIGLPNQGLQILYEILNERDDAVAERAYAPWVDMEAAMRSEGIPLFSLEGTLPARAFDVLAFNLSAELVYTNVLNLIDLAQVPLHGADRTPSDPVVVAGGHCAFNPEPLADFIDCFVLGDGEEAVGEINEVIAAHRRRPADGTAGAGAGSRESLLRALSQLSGVYVPACYEAAYGPHEHVVGPDDGAPAHRSAPRLTATTPRFPDTPGRVEKRTIADLAEWPYPKQQLVPLIEVVHDRLNVELFRGCTRGCRFCQAGMITRPVRERPAEQVRRTGLTFAPEGGTWRMRQVINKLIREEDLYAAVDAAFSQGWKRVKLYFLIGLPTETDEDTLGVVALAKQCVAIGRRYHKGVTVTASVGGFVPKVQTPFQWFGQNTIEELTRKVHLLRDAARPVRGLTIRWHDPKATAAEGVVSRGDRRMGAVIEQVWRNGGTFQEWSEYFDLELWTEALADHGMSLEDTVYRHRTEHEVLPWDHLSAGLHRDFLWQDWVDALANHGLEDCRWTPCYDCGACTGFGVEHVVASAVPPAGGSQGTGQDLSTGGQVPVRFLTTAPSGAGPAPGSEERPSVRAGEGRG